jgi:hypothetical protein
MSVEILEEGRIYFFYRPRVDHPEVRSLADVQRFFFALRPGGTEHFRVVLVGRKRMPEVEESHERLWAKVTEVTAVVDGVDRLRELLGPKTYETKTRGRRHLPKARPAGDGVYILARHEKHTQKHTHLAYELLLPESPGPVQRALGICDQASYIVAVRNPCAPPPPDLEVSRRRGPELPEDLLARFGDLRFLPVDPPAFLDHEGVDLVLIGVSGDVAGELGIDLDAEAERIWSRDIFEELRLRRDRQQADPLERGLWR